MTAWLVALLGGPLLLLGGGGVPVLAPPATSVPPTAAVVRRVGALPATAMVARPQRPQRPPQSPGRARFNDPFGTRDEKYALIRRIDARIDRAERGAVVRVAAFSFAMRSTSRAMLRAHRRGVQVRMVVDRRSVRWGSVRRLRHALGTDTEHRSFVRVCRESCRGDSGNQHAKFVTISGAGRAGRADGVVMVGSMNFTHNAAARQWQDLYTVTGDRSLFRQFARVFRLMARDRPQRRLELRPPGAGFRTEVSPLPGVARADDPVLRRLGRVHCHGARRGTGTADGRTLLRVSMHAWNGRRGVALARRTSSLARQGCQVRVLAGVGVGPRVVNVLRRGGVDVRDSARRGRATHQKLMIVSGHFGRRHDASFVWTGSHNWTDRSLVNDEVTLRIAGPRPVEAYRANFRRIWVLARR